MDTFTRKETDENEIEQVNTFLSGLIIKLKKDTKASEKEVKNFKKRIKDLKPEDFFRKP